LEARAIAAQDNAVAVGGNAAAVDKPAYVLVHGAWHGAWTYQKVIPELAALGHAAVAVDLPALGLRQSALPGLGQERNARVHGPGVGQHLPQPIKVDGTGAPREGANRAARRGNQARWAKKRVDKRPVSTGSTRHQLEQVV
jgi:pimeloyl-ACP methyl ester carboxylesterase